MTDTFNHPRLCPCDACMRSHVRAQAELLARAAELLKTWSDSKEDGDTVTWLADYARRQSRGAR